MIDLTKKPAAKSKDMIDNLEDLADKIDSLRLRTCYRYGSCENCPAHFGQKSYGCAFARIITEAESIIDNLEEN